MQQTIGKYLIAVTVVIILIAGRIAQAEVYRFIVPGIYSVSGRSENQMRVISEEFFKLLAEITGEEFEIVQSESSYEEYLKETLELVVSKKVDFVGINGEIYAKLPEAARAKLPPLIGMQVYNNKNQNTCFYVRKSDGIENVEQLRGTRFASTSYTDARYLLYKDGIDEPLEKFFSSVKYREPDWIKTMTALVEGRIDSFTAWDFYVKNSIGGDERFKDVEPIGCEYVALTSFFFYRKGMDPEVPKKILKVISHIDNDKRFDKFKFFFAAIGAKIYAVQPEDLDLTLKVDALIRKNGWDKELENFEKKK